MKWRMGKCPRQLTMEDDAIEDNYGTNKSIENSAYDNDVNNCIDKFQFVNKMWEDCTIMRDQWH